MGMWSEPVDGRGVSQVMKNGARAGEAKARSITEGLASPPRGNLVYTPGILRSEKPRSVAREKYGKETDISVGLYSLDGSAIGLWMLKSPTTRVGRGEGGKANSGETVRADREDPTRQYRLTMRNS